MVSVLAFYSDDPRSNPAEVYNFSVKIFIEKNENKQKRGRGWPIFLSNRLPQIMHRNVDIPNCQPWPVTAEKSFTVLFAGGGKESFSVAETGFERTFRLLSEKKIPPSTTSRGHSFSLKQKNSFTSKS